ncbi:hypothetical protein J6590_014557 [Homalodisca vitripennis]|nr:hypothetical protein J6590_014557 [Homalodisca vitripennis]
MVNTISSAAVLAYNESPRGLPLPAVGTLLLPVLYYSHLPSLPHNSSPPHPHGVDAAACPGCLLCDVVITYQHPSPAPATANHISFPSSARCGGGRGEPPLLTASIRTNEPRLKISYDRLRRVGIKSMDGDNGVGTAMGLAQHAVCRGDRGRWLWGPSLQAGRVHAGVAIATLLPSPPPPSLPPHTIIPL